MISTYLESGKFAGFFTDEENIPEGYFIAQVEYPNNLIDGYFDTENQTWYENASEDLIIEQKMLFVQQFRELRVATARNFMQQFSDEVTLFLIGKPSAIVDEIDEQLINTVHAAFAFLNSRNADYWTARREINAMIPPTNLDALNFFNEVKNHINEFVTNNYPTNEL